MAPPLRRVLTPLGSPAAFLGGWAAPVVSPPHRGTAAHSLRLTALPGALPGCDPFVSPPGYPVSARTVRRRVPPTTESRARCPDGPTRRLHSIISCRRGHRGPPPSGPRYASFEMSSKSRCRAYVAPSLVQMSWRSALKKPARPEIRRDLWPQFARSCRDLIGNGQIWSKSTTHTHTHTETAGWHAG